MEKDVQKLFRFLKNENAYYNFRKNIPKERMPKLIARKINMPPSCLMLESFGWHNTTEGTLYWNSLTMKLQNKGQ